MKSESATRCDTNQKMGWLSFRKLRYATSQQWERNKSKHNEEYGYMRVTMRKNATGSMRKKRTTGKRKQAFNALKAFFEKRQINQGSR